MAGGKLNARQKMINMMYLVLTALLALNVAKEVLNAFVVINMGLLQQKESIHAKNTAMLNQFNNQLLWDTANQRLKYLSEQAIYIQQISDEFSKDVEQMKVDLVVKVDNVDANKALEVIKNPMQVKHMDDYDGPTRFFGTNEAPGTTGKANDLKNKISTYRDNCLKVVDKVLASRTNKSKNDEVKKDIMLKLDILLTNDPANNKEYPTWEMQYFYRLPLVAALTELTKWENFVKGAELDMLTFLWEDLNAQIYKFDQIKVAVIPKSNFVTSGSNFEAEVFLAAYSSSGSNPPTIVYGTGVDSNSLNVTGGVTLSPENIKNGVAKISIPVSGQGERTFAGTLQLSDPSGNIKKLPFSTKYNVAPPTATIAPTELNVVYYGVDNPFSISVPGVAPNQIIVSASGASIKGSNGSYVINPTNTTGQITINVSARKDDGTVQKMGSQNFRIKRVPNPEILIANKPCGSVINKNLLAMSPIIPDMAGFLFPVYAQVTSVKGSLKAGSGDLQQINFSGNQFDEEAKRKIRVAPEGSKLFLEEIKVKLPGGTRTMSCFYTLTNR